MAIEDNLEIRDNLASRVNVERRVCQVWTDVVVVMDSQGCLDAKGRWESQAGEPRDHQERKVSLVRMVCLDCLGEMVGRARLA
jgi:hypothetical protein